MAKVKKYEDVLMSAFYFDAQDLAANQAGKYSDWQVNRLRAEVRRAVSALAILLFGSAVVVAGGLSLGAARPQSAGFAVTFIALLLLVGIFISYYWLKNQDAAADLRQHQVSTVVGRVALSATSSGEGVRRYVARIDKLRFTLKQQEFLAFKNGDPYRIYYAPQSKRILSLVWLRDPDVPLFDPDETDSGDASYHAKHLSAR